MGRHIVFYWRRQLTFLDSDPFGSFMTVLFFFFLIWHEKCPLSVLGLFVIEQEKAYFKPENAVMSRKDQHSI